MSRGWRTFARHDGEGPVPPQRPNLAPMGLGPRGGRKVETR